MDAIHRRDLQYLSLRTAAAVAHIRLVGAAPNARDTLAMQRTLNDVASALAALAPIYYLSETGCVAVDQRAIVAGRFERGAAVLVLPGGKQYTRLLIQRRDLDAAIDILRRTRLPADLCAVRDSAAAG